MKEIITNIVTTVSTLGGWETAKYFVNRKANGRIAEAKADGSEFSVIRDTMIFLQEQLRDKEKRFAEQTELVRKLNIENLELTRKIAMLEAERAMKLCERRNCPTREPQSGY